MESLPQQEQVLISKQDIISAQGEDLTYLQPSSIHCELNRSSSLSLQESWKAQRADAELRKCLGKNSSEVLLKSYSCAWQKDILVQGWETKTSIKFTDVTSISKQRTALVFPNAILIEAGPKKYGFASVVHRDKVYHVLVTIWRNSLSPTPLAGSTLLAAVNNWKHKDLPSSVLSSSFAADGSESDQETHSHHTLPISTHEDSMDSDSLPETELEQTDIGFLGGRLSSSSGEVSCTDSGSTESVDTNNSCKTSDSSVNNSHIDDMPLTHHHGNQEQRALVKNEQLHWFKHEFNIGGFSHKFQALRQFSLVKQCTSTALINILLIVFIIALLASTLTMFCRLSYVEPSLQPYLVFQPWCHWCSTPPHQLTITPAHLH